MAGHGCMRLKVVVAILVLTFPALAETFDTASIRKSSGAGAGDPGEILRDGPRLSPVTFTMRNATLKSCMCWAWDVMESQISGPGWLATERFDIQGKAVVPTTEAEFRVMLQALLTERFHLEFHRQTKEQSVYVLVIGKNGPKFRESAAEGEPNIVPDTARMSIAVKHAKVSTLADLLSKILFMPVIDQTGMNGYYDISVNVAKYLPQFAGDGIPDIMGIINAGLQEELGLKLESKKVALDLLVVDNIDKTPTEN